MMQPKKRVLSFIEAFTYLVADDVRRSSSGTNHVSAPTARRLDWRPGWRLGCTGGKFILGGPESPLKDGVRDYVINAYDILSSWEVLSFEAFEEAPEKKKKTRKSNRPRKGSRK